MIENNRTEYKRELNDCFERSIVFFLNYAGDGEISGVLIDWFSVKIMRLYWG